MLRTAWTVGHFRKVPIRLHVSLLFVLPFVAWAIGGHTIPHLVTSMGHDVAQLHLPPLIFGALTSVALFLAVLLHELGHAYIALVQGARVRSITLMILGGVTEIDQDDATPSEALRTALAGPVANLVLGVLTMLAVPFTLFSLDAYIFLFLFACLNLFLGVFNLVPAFPLDGARALKAILRMRFPDIQATQMVAVLGRLVAVGTLCFAFVRGDLVLGLFAVFLFLGASAEVTGVETRDALEGLTNRQAMCIRVVTVGADRPTTSVARHMLLQDAKAAIVQDINRVYGVVMLRHLRAAGQQDVGSLVEGGPLWAEADGSLAALAREMRWQRKPAIVTDQSNAIVGVVTVDEIRRAAELKRLADRSLGVTGATVEKPQSHS